MTTLKIRKSVIAIAVASALGIMAPSAHALTITATTNASVGALSDPESNTALMGSVSSYSNLSPNNESGYASARSNGNDSGLFAGSASVYDWGYYPGDWLGDDGGNIIPVSLASTTNSASNLPLSATSYYSFSDEYTNTSGVAQQYDLGFHIDQGSLSIDTNAADTFNSSYSLDILLNGSSIWGSSAALSSSGLTETGTSLNGTLSSGYYDYYDWDEFFGNLDLGVVAAGESFTLEYVMNLGASGTCTFDGCEGSSYAQIGDPFNLSTNPLHNPTLSMSPISVPEPSTLALLGLGLAGVVVAGKRRRK